MSRSVSVIVVEGALEVPASIKMLRALDIPAEGTFPINKGGRNKFWRDVQKYNNASMRLDVVLAIADLESSPCPSGLIQTHLPGGRHRNFILRVAERSLESWLLADRAGISDFLHISKALIPRNPDAESNPKLTLVNLARRSPSSQLKEDLVPEQGSAGIVGKGYTPRMSEYIRSVWQPCEAGKNSESLRRALAAIQNITKA